MVPARLNVENNKHNTNNSEVRNNTPLSNLQAGAHAILTVNCGLDLQACMAQCTEVLTAGEEATQKGDLEVVQANHSTSQ